MADDGKELAAQRLARAGDGHQLPPLQGPPQRRVVHRALSLPVHDHTGGPAGDRGVDRGVCKVADELPSESR
jgi:hypothetical protein